MPISPANYRAVWTSPVGMLGIRIENDALCGIDVLSPGIAPRAAVDKLAGEVVEQLNAYFCQSYYEFDLPLALNGTDYQQRVWRTLQTIRPGEKRTYGEVAQAIGSGPRAVGNACRRNPLPFVVPCHRVVSANGLGGYAGAVKGAMLERKKWLLEHEVAR